MMKNQENIQYPEPNGKCVVMSVSFLEMVSDKRDMTQLIDDMRNKGNYVVLALRNKEDSYSLSPSHIAREHFSELHEMVTLSNPEDYGVLSYQRENTSDDDKKNIIGKFHENNVVLLDKYQACRNAVKDFGGNFVDIQSDDKMPTIRKKIEDMGIL